MRSLSRGLVVGMLALPLAFTGAGLAAASGGDANSQMPASHKHHADFNWDWKWTHVSDDDTNYLNEGIIG